MFRRKSENVLFLFTFKEYSASEGERLIPSKLVARLLKFGLLGFA